MAKKYCNDISRSILSSFFFYQNNIVEVEIKQTNHPSDQIIYYSNYIFAQVLIIYALLQNSDVSLLPKTQPPRRDAYFKISMTLTAQH